MSSPYGYGNITPAPLNVPVGSQVGAIWTGTPGAAQVMIANTDPVNTVYIGYINNLAQGAPNAVPLGPISAQVFNGLSTIYAVAPDGTMPLSITPGSPFVSASPVAIASAIAESGIALAIAEALAAGGINLLGAPQLQYNVGLPPGPPGSSGAWGASCFGGGNSNTVDTQTFQTNSGIKVAAARVYMMGSPAENIYANVSDFPGDLMAAYNLGMIAVISYEPAFSGSRTSNNLPSMAQMLTDQNNMVASLNSIIAAGFPASKLRVTMYHEPENPSKDISAAQFLNLYSTVVTGSGLTNYAALHAICPVYYIALADEVNATKNMTYIPAIPNLASNFIDVMLADWYGSSYTSVPGKFLGNYNNMAIAANIPFGLGEWWPYGLSNADTVKYLLAESITFDGTEYAGDPVNSMEAVMGGRLIAGQTNAEIIAFVNATALGDVTGPNSFLSTVMQKLSTTLAGGGGNEGNIPANSSTTLVPISPSQIAGYAPATGISYDITFNIIAGVGSTNPFVSVKLEWFNEDSPTALAVDTEVWDLPMGTNGTTGTIPTGVGPQRGQFWQINIFNHDTVACFLACQANSTARNVESHDWIWDAASSVAVPGFNLPGGGSFRNSLGVVNNISVPANDSITRLMGLRTGAVWLQVVGDAAGDLSFELQPQPQSAWGQGAVYGPHTPTAPDFGIVLQLPRAACQLTISNSKSSAVNGSVIMIASR